MPTSESNIISGSNNVTTILHNIDQPLTLNVTACDVSNYARKGSDLVVTMNDGTVILVKDYFDLPDPLPAFFVGKEHSGEELLVAELDKTTKEGPIDIVLSDASGFAIGEACLIPSNQAASTGAAEIAGLAVASAIGIVGLEQAFSNGDSRKADTFDTNPNDSSVAEPTTLSSRNAYTKIIAYSQDSSNPSPSTEDYADAGISGVSANNVDQINAIIEAMSPGDIDSIGELQPLIDEYLVQANKDTQAAAEQQAAEEQAAEEQAAQEQAEAEQLAAEQAAAEEQAAADAAQAEADAAQAVIDEAVAKIAAYADDNTNPAPSLEDYQAAGTTGVTADNLDSINARIDSTTGVLADSPEEIQAQIDSQIAQNEADVQAAAEEQAAAEAQAAQEQAEAEQLAAEQAAAEQQAAEEQAAADAAQAEADAAQAVIDEAVAKIAAYADDNTNPAPSLEDYQAAGTTGVTAENLDSINARIDSTEGVFADSPEEIQAQIDSQIAQNEADAQAAAEAQAAQDQAEAEQLAAEQAAAEQQAAEEQAAADAAQAEADAEQAVIDEAVAKIAAYADDSTNPAPTLEDYQAAGTTGVTAENLDSINARIDSTTGALADSPEEIQAQIDSQITQNEADAQAAAEAQAAQDQAAAEQLAAEQAAAEQQAAEEQAAADAAQAEADAAQAVIDEAVAKIAAYADDNSNPAPTLEDYDAAEVTGVTAENLASVNAKVDSVSGINADSTAEIQALVNDQVAQNEADAQAAAEAQAAQDQAEAEQLAAEQATAEQQAAEEQAAADAAQAAADAAQAVIDEAVAKIAAYADDNTNPTPLLQDYEAAGTTGVTAENLDSINARIDSTEGVFADSPEEIQAQIDSQIAQNEADAQAASEAQAAADTAQAEADAAQAEIDEAVAKIAAYADDSTNPAPSLEDYQAAGTTGVTADNLDSINARIDSTTGVLADSPEEIQAQIDSQIAQNEADAQAAAEQQAAEEQAEAEQLAAEQAAAEQQAAEEQAAADAAQAEADAAQAVIDEAVAKIAAYADDSTNPAPSL
uniref:BapA prefix-like domain-containing protein n=1 Tax=Zhongshania aliphaticivorans TaxID=1470434 RepID=UPI0039C9C46C